jgi:hypothetical protein
MPAEFDISTIKGAQNRREVWRLLTYLRRHPDARVTPQRWLDYRLINRRRRPQHFTNGQKINLDWVIQLLRYCEAGGLLTFHVERNPELKSYWTTDRETCCRWIPDWDTDGRSVKRRRRPVPGNRATGVFEGMTFDA